MANAGSGVGVSDECIDKFQDLKLGHKLRYIIFKLSDAMEEIVIEHEGEPDKTYADFKVLLPENDCRYCVFDYAFIAPDGGERNKIVFITWAPDTAKIKPKMLYASSKDSFRKKLVGIGAELQATDASEIDETAVSEKVLRDAR